MPLLIAPINVPLRVLKVGGDPAVAKHLASLGITRDASIVLLGKSGSSALCEVRGTRLAISKDVAGMIAVHC